MKHDYNLDELNTVNVRGLKFNIMPRYTYHYLDNDYEQFSLDLLDSLIDEGSVAIDIGAHYGIYSLLAAKKAKKVYAFEPVPENFAILQKNAQDNHLGHITPINKAVSDKEGNVTFNVTWASDSAGFYDHPNAEVIRKIDVQTNSIDNELANVKNVSFIKIDTEGHEIHVLDGLQKTLAANKNAKLLIEFNPQCLLNAGCTSKELLQKIESLGYDIFGVYEQTRYMTRIDVSTPEEDILLGGTYLNLLCLPKGSWLSTVFVAHSTAIGGGEIALLETTRGLLRLKNKFVIPLVIFPGDGPLVDRFRKLPVPIKLISMRWWVNRDTMKPDEQEQIRIVNAQAMTELARVLTQFKPQVVLTNTMVVPWGALAAKAYGIPHIWSIHEFGDLDHRLHFDYGYEQTVKLIDDLSGQIKVNSKAVQKHVGRYLTKHKPELLYLNVGQPSVSSKKPPAVFGKAADIKLVMSGNVMPSKGQLEGVQAVQELRARGHKAELMIMGTHGDKPYVQEIKQYIAQHKLEKYVHIVGYKDNPFDHVDMADMLLVCSDNEAFGLVTVEAMLLGKPVVGANSGATPEIIQDGKTGYLYKSHDIQDLARKIEQFATSKNKKHMAEAAKQHAQKHFQGDYAKAMFDSLDKLARKQHNQPAAGLYADLLTGLQGWQDKHAEELRSLETSSRKELQKFSAEYNKVYEAYNQIEGQLKALNRRKAVRIQHKLDRMRPSKRRKAS